MTTSDSVFQRVLSNMLTEIFDGPPGQEAYLLNPGDPGLLRQLDTIDAGVASRRLVVTRTAWDDLSAAAALSTAAHTAYHLGALRQILAGS